MHVTPWTTHGCKTHGVRPAFLPVHLTFRIIRVFDLNDLEFNVPDRARIVSSRQNGKMVIVQYQYIIGTIILITSTNMIGIVKIMVDQYCCGNTNI